MEKGQEKNRNPGLLICDIGNSCLKVGLANSVRIVATSALPFENYSSEGSVSAFIRSFLKKRKVYIYGCIIVSVNPALNGILKKAVSGFTEGEILFAQEDINFPLENCYTLKEQTGADRLAACYGARSLYPSWRSIIVVDYGTAVTFDCLEGNRFLGGLIFPGIKLAIQALAVNTAKLPVVEIEESAFSIGTDTRMCIKNGLLYGYISMTEGLCDRLCKLLPKPVRIVATGGYAGLLKKWTTRFDAVEPFLVMEGLRSLYFGKG